MSGTPSWGAESPSQGRPPPSSYASPSSYLAGPSSQPYNPPGLSSLPAISPTFGSSPDYFGNAASQDPAARGVRPKEPSRARGPTLSFTVPRGGGSGGGGGGSSSSARGSGPSKRGRGSRSNPGRQSTRTSTRPDPSKVKTIKLSLKTSGAGSGVGGRLTSFLGEYDRELDENPEEPLAFEEQFILRVPREVAEGRGEGTGTGLREMVKGKGKGLEGIEFKFLDARRAAFKINGVTYASKLVDLPCIIESQKTFDNRHLFKVADISQMLIVDHAVPTESAIPPASGHPEDYIWPHGITPPLRHVRKRRFRKRMSRRAIEVVEEQVEDLLTKDREAEATSYDLIDAHPDADIADSYYVDYDPETAWQQLEAGSEFGGSEMYEDPGSAVPHGDWPEGEGEYGGVEDGGGDDGGEEDGDGYMEEGEEDVDNELAAALMAQLEGQGEEAGSADETSVSEDEDEVEDDEGYGSGSGSEDEEDEETLEKKAKIRQFASEIKALETAIEKRRAGFTGGNPIMVKRFEETIKGMEADIHAKNAARQALVDELERSKPVAAPPAPVSQSDQGAFGRARDNAAASGSALGTPLDTPGLDADVDEMDLDVEGEEEYEDGSTPAAARRDEDSPRYADAEEDDLFGDEGGEGEVGGVGAIEVVGGRMDVDPVAPIDDRTGRRGAGGQAQNDEEEEDAEGEEEEDGQGDDDEMAALLREELGQLDNAATVDSPMAPPAGATPNAEAQEQAEAFDALEDFAMSGRMDEALQMQPSSPVYDYNAVEGGVGMRRLAQGVAADDDDESSDESDD